MEQSRKVPANGDISWKKESSNSPLISKAENNSAGTEDGKREGVKGREAVWRRREEVDQGG